MDYSTNKNLFIEGEIWKDISGYEGIYQVSSLQRIKMLAHTVIRSNSLPYYHKEKIQSQYLRVRRGSITYRYVQLYKDGNVHYESIHRVIAIAFIPNPENKPCVNHKDGNKLNNTIDNLEWSTYSENNLHAFSANLRENKKGADNPQSIPIIQKYPNGEVIKIWDNAYHIKRVLGFPTSSINNALKRQNNAYKGFIWTKQNPNKNKS